MHTQTKTRLLSLFLLAAVVLMILWQTAPAASMPVCEKETPEAAQTAGTQLLWESLSHQFVSSVQY